tara:strand:- start:298 stop:450 length:153 start_codon:yes stop_codon:yes gene_type:complete
MSYDIMKEVLKVYDIANDLHHEGLHDDAKIYEIALYNLLESHRETIEKEG